MPYELFLALRYLRARRRRRAAQITELASVVGICCGVAALIIATALARGFQDEMRDKILRGTAHITLAPVNGNSVDWRAVLAQVRGVDGVTSATITTYTSALVASGGVTAYAVLRGVDVESRQVVDEFRGTLVAGRVDAAFAAENVNNQAAPVIIGEELVRQLNLSIGDAAQILLAPHPSTVFSQPPRTSTIKIVGIFRSDLHDYDATWIYMALPNLNSLSSTNGANGLAVDQTGRNLASGVAPVVSVEVADIYNVAETEQRIRLLFGDGWTTVNWQRANAPLFAALTLERQVVMLIISLITIIAALNILTTLTLLVTERRSHIAILNAIGARASSVMAVFTIEGALLGLVGVIAGVLLGLAACLVANRYELVQLPSDVYSLRVVPLRPHFSDVAWASLIALIVSVLATLYPARLAARTAPAEALRDA